LDHCQTWRDKSGCQGVGAVAEDFRSADHVQFSPLTFHALPSICVPVIRPSRSEYLLLIDM